MRFFNSIVSALPFAFGALASPFSPPQWGGPPATYGNVTDLQPNPHWGHWVDTWVSMPQLTEFHNLPPGPFNETDLVFYNSTIRQTLKITLGADQIRLRLSNAFGLNELPVTKVNIALPVAEMGQNLTGSSGIDTSTIHSLTFSGNESIIIPAGAQAVSDPIAFPVNTSQILSVNMYLADGQASNYVTSHPGSRTQIWMSRGDFTEAANLTDPSVNTTFHWYFISGIEAWSPPQDSTFVVLGDSITDGRASWNNGNGRWTDYLFTRMHKFGPTKDISVANQAAGGNRILRDGNGPNVLARFDRDVLAQSGVKYAMIFEGVNDIGVADNTTYNQTLTGDRIIQAYEQLITRSHAKSIPFFGATITPFGAPNTTIQSYATPERLATRRRVNDWIRNSGRFDAVIDFDAVVRDPENPERLAPRYDSGDFLHPNEAGYHAMARAFPLDIFEKYSHGVSQFV
ncbi:extracellular GDSL-like lipase/acylhydrolase [Hortaea werneckii]|nr:extracellular GDSL-like lipase/acylhydrolase [Hortaea werneckii]